MLVMRAMANRNRMQEFNCFLSVGERLVEQACCDKLQCRGANPAWCHLRLFDIIANFYQFIAKLLLEAFRGSSDQANLTSSTSFIAKQCQATRLKNT